MVAHLQLAPPLSETEQAVAAAPIRVVLADDHALILRGLRLLLEGEEGIDVVAEAGDLASAVRQVSDHKAHVLVLELRTRGGAGSRVIGELRERAPDTQLVVLTMNDSPVFAQHALASGALGFVLKELADGELPQAVRAAAAGSHYVSPRVAPRLEALHRATR